METLEECYQFVAEVMFERIPEPWTKAWMDIELDHDWGRFTGDYIAENGEEKWFSPGHQHNGQTLLHVFTQMSALMKHPDHKAWNKCRFHLSSEGDFKLDVEYPTSSDATA